MKYRRTIRRLLEDRALNTPDSVFAVHEDREIRFRDLNGEVNRLANGLFSMGAGPGTRVAVMLANHLDHIRLFFALCKLGAVWVPINVKLRGPGLAYIFEQAAPEILIAEEEFRGVLEGVLPERRAGKIFFRGFTGAGGGSRTLDFRSLVQADPDSPAPVPQLDEIRCISFTSGTTGPPKGVLMTERMLRACATGASLASDVRADDVFLLWEPLYHTSGSQMCILALSETAKLVVIPRFSASRFWDQIRSHGVTKIHYLGGVLDVLLKQPPASDDRNHRAVIAFGGGCGINAWRPFEKRFGVKIREVYGLTEASGFTTRNSSGKVGSIGKALPYFEVRIVDESGKASPVGSSGEIAIREKQPGLITAGYLNNPEATAEALRGGWLYTGDLGRCDEQGDFYYLGRKKDSIRRRGENISAWEVELVLNAHPEIQESAVIGVAAQVGEQEVKAFIITTPGSSLEALEIVKWCEPRMAYYQMPRYISFLKAFEKTATHRIRKETLSRKTDDCWDLEASGYRSGRKTV